MPTPRRTAAALKTYRAKRDFNSSPEPSGDSDQSIKPSSKSGGRARAKSAGKSKGKSGGKIGDASPKSGFFCVQKHLASHLHYDFRLEHDGVLLSWAVPKGPSLNPKDKRLAMRVEDHPLDYGDFEGVIPEGYGAGVVMLWDRGVWTPEPQTPDTAKALAAGELKFTLEGTKLKGSWVLVRTGHGKDGGESRTWLLIKHKDQWAGPIDVIEAAPLSVKSFGDFADILAADNPSVWESHRPATGGAAGEMLQKVIDAAARLKVKESKKTSPAHAKAKAPKTAPFASKRAPR